MLKEYKIKELGDISTGNTPSKKIKEFYDSKDIMFIKPDDIDEDIKELTSSREYISFIAKEKSRIIPKNTLLVTCIGSIGKIAINKEESAFNQQINAIVPNNKIFSSKYLAYVIMNNKEKLKAIANAPVVPIINKTQFSEFKVYIHDDLGVQKKIVDILDKAQKLINKRKLQIEELDLLVKSKFIEMFGDLKSNSKKWSILNFNDFAIIDTNMTKDFETYKEYPHIGIDSIEKNTGNILEYSLVKDCNLKSGKYIFDERHIIYSKIRPNLNKVALPNFKGVCSADSYPILCINGVTERVYLGYVLRSEFFLNYILNFSGRTNIPKVNKEQLKGFNMPVPPIELQNQFANFVKQVDKLKFEMEHSLKELEDNFNSLIQKAFN
ncbi:TPA: restriction endonuclease subunit S [Clostridioides difficile]|uniref:restriction endonuclease subunit S n=1 Tax=Clostridioides difficile TaxID=1496 RepID=UPI00097FEE83|nr:restriction endonuclease subunit S [Clostridioides difficile]AXU26434.1 type I restriction-modification system subunit S [Clostridioides difficile]AXU30294.1 type I restriction-modification system subunit S [Clostridioides difficile]AXU34082.1 type I restriction-modification system subunit S [Clostridioides difficile]MCP8411379.1 restriction endonuclease subunit S [Clostridioides difficile]MDC9391151.1 restriction endonuclease subunit S [Clostridioides difficile]